MTKPVLTIDLTGPDGNIYAVIAKVCIALKLTGQRDKAADLRKKAFKQRSYDAVLKLCQEYADITYIR